MNDYTIHKPIMKGTIMPVLGTAQAKDGVLTSSNLDQWMQTPTDLADGLYQIVGKTWQPSKIGMDEFPPMPVLKPKGKATLTLDRIACARLLACMSTDETRYILCSILFRVHEKGISLCSTDGRRLTVCEWPCKVAKLAHGDYIIKHLGRANTHPLALLMRDKKRDEVTVTFAGDMVQFANGEQTLTVKTCEGTYPNYKQVIPKDQQGLLRVDQRVMVDALKELLPFRPKLRKYITSTSVVVEFREVELLMTMSDVDRDIKHTVSVPCKHERRGKIEQIALDLDRLMDAFIHPDGIVYMSHQDELTPIATGTHLAGGQIGPELSVVMPMRTT